MTITSADLKFFRAQYPLDLSYGGGLMSNVVVQDGVGNNVFPNIAPADRVSGRVSMRKVFAAAINADATQLLSAQVRIKTRPTDANVDNVLFAFGDQTTTRAAAEAALAIEPFIPGGGLGVYTRTSTYVGNFTVPPAVGDLVAFYSTVMTGFTTVTTLFSLQVVQSVSGSDATFLSPVPVGVSAALAGTNPLAPRCCGTATLTAASGSSSVTVDRMMAQLLPQPASSPINGFAPPLGTGGLAKTGGKVPIFRTGETVLLEEGGTSETPTILSLNRFSGEITFTAPLAHAYTAGAKLSSLANVGDMIAFVGPSFSQQTWTKVFSDAVIGNLISANYNRAASTIAIDNLGAATERWAIVFTSSTEFKLIGERVGQVANGDTGTLFEPVNPITGGKFFSIPTAGWGTGWSIGNVLRFNTLAPRAPVWLTRTVSPSAPSGSDQVIIDVRGGV